jgi:hypothetical protein
MSAAIGAGRGVDERHGDFLDETRPVVDFMRQQYWFIYAAADRKRMLGALERYEADLSHEGY